MEEPYWTAEDWETWAVGMYKDVPEARKFIPAWIVKELRDE